MDYSESFEYDEVKSFHGKGDKLFHAVRGMKIVLKLGTPLT